MEDKKKRYIVTEPGTGHSPHVLTNPDDQNDTISLCSCGGTRNPMGLCDNTHLKKNGLGCPCWYCKAKHERLERPFDQDSKCG